MKRVVPLLLVVLLLSIHSGCNRGPASSIPVETQIPYAFDYGRLWTFDPGHPGYTRIGAAHEITWDNGDVDLNWSASPLEYAESGYANSEKRMENGIIYYIQENKLAGDSTDANNHLISHLTFTRQLQFEQDGFRLSLSASASQKEHSLEMASISTALTLASHPGLAVPGFIKITEGWHTGFQNGNLNLSISISPPPFDQHVIDPYLTEADYAWTSTEDGFQYIYSGRDRDAGDPLSAFILARTELGSVTIHGGVPHLKRDTVPADSLDYIDIDLVRAVVAWVKGG